MEVGDDAKLPEDADTVFTQPEADAAGSVVKWEIHVGAPPITEEVAADLEKLRLSVIESDVYKRNTEDLEEYLTQTNLHRYYRARQGDLEQAQAMLLSSVQWRSVSPNAPRGVLPSLCVQLVHARGPLSAFVRVLPLPVSPSMDAAKAAPHDPPGR